MRAAVWKWNRVCSAGAWVARYESKAATAQRDESPDGHTVMTAPERKGSVLDCLMCTWKLSPVLSRSLWRSERSATPEEGKECQ